MIITREVRGSSQRVAAVLVAMLLCAATVVGGTPAGARRRLPTLTPDHRLLSWKGERLTGSSGGTPEGCTPETCDEYRFRVRHPRGFWRGHKGGVEVSIRWGSEQDDFDLYVFRGERLVASSTGAFSYSEGVLVRRARRGRYRAVVTLTNADNADYEGIVQLERRRRRHGPVRKLLPNLKTRRPRDFKIVAPAFYGTGREIVPYNGDRSRFSCYADEVAETGALRCLRFSNAISNLGRGRFTLKMKVDSAGDERRMYQIIRRSNGSKTRRRAGRYTIHATHAHFHYEGFAEYKLFEVNRRGERTGVASRGRKSGFCLIDTTLVWWKMPRNQPRRYSFPSCNVPEEGDGTYVMGISRGWADVYTWDLPDQYVDITGLRDGVYELRSKADAAGKVLETKEKDNARSVFVRIDGDDAKRVPRPGS